MALTTPTMAAAEARQHATFRSLMWALSNPGSAQQLPVGGQAAFAAIGEALLDLETGFFTPHPELYARLAHTGARPLTPDTAPYQFYPQLGLSELELLSGAPIGTYREPDTAATIVVGCRFASATPPPPASLRPQGEQGASRHHGPHPLSPAPAAQERGDAPQRDLVRLMLRGPGIAPAGRIPSAATLQIAGLPLDLWRLRAERGPYPLGWDLFLVDGERVVGLPRTTQVEVL